MLKGTFSKASLDDHEDVSKSSGETQLMLVFRHTECTNRCRADRADDDRLAAGEPSRDVLSGCMRTADRRRRPVVEPPTDVTRIKAFAEAAEAIGRTRRAPAYRSSWLSNPCKQIDGDDGSMAQDIGDACTLRSRVHESRKRIGRSSRLMAVSRSAIDRSREAIRSSNACLVSPIHEPEPDVGLDAVRALLTDHDHATMHSVVEEFSSAYREAVATGDEETAGLVRKALLILGRRLADDLGPRAGGASIH